MKDHSVETTDEFSFILRPSAIPMAGIGVFTTHAIKKGIKMKISPENIQIRRLRGSEIPQLFKGFCIAEEGGWYKCPAQFNHMEIGWFINHSDRPNLERREDGWYSLREIEAGEEILIDYNALNEPEDQKEPYYKHK